MKDINTIDGIFVSVAFISFGYKIDSKTDFKRIDVLNSYYIIVTQYVIHKSPI